MVPNYCVQNLSVSSEKHNTLRDITSNMTWKKNDLKILWNGSVQELLTRNTIIFAYLIVETQMSRLFCKVRPFTVPEGDESYIIL